MLYRLYLLVTLSRFLHILMKSGMCLQVALIYFISTYIRNEYYYLFYTNARNEFFNFHIKTLLSGFKNNNKPFENNFTTVCFLFIYKNMKRKRRHKCSQHRFLTRGICTEAGHLGSNLLCAGIYAPRHLDAERVNCSDHYLPMAKV